MFPNEIYHSMDYKRGNRPHRECSLLRARIHFKDPDMSGFVDPVIIAELANARVLPLQDSGAFLRNIQHLPPLRSDHPAGQGAANAF